MFTIEGLLDLFEDDKVKKMILSTFLLSQSKNKELSDIVFQHFFTLKLLYPNLNIEIDYTQDAASNYTPLTNTINLNGIFDVTTFLHELTHLFSYYYSQFTIPQGFDNLKSDFLSSNENNSLVILFLDLCKKEKEKVLQIEPSLAINNNIDKNLGDMSFESNYDYFIICKLADIIDSIYSGKSYTSGLTYLKDNSSYAKKSSKSAGHGCDYFNKTGYEFEEIIADYQAIKMIDPNNQLFVLLKQILGNDLVSFLDDMCQLINGKTIIKIEQSNNVGKK